MAPVAVVITIGSLSVATHPAADVLLSIVDMEAPPLRLILGAGGLPMIRREYEERLATWDKYDQLSNQAQGGPAS